MPDTLPRRLCLPPACMEAIQAAARAAYPDECCGFLVGDGDGDVTVVSVRPTDNTAPERRTSFAVAPQEHFDLLRETRGGPLRIIGHYHSHPNGAAMPSKHDLAMAYDPGAIWVIVAVDHGKAAVPRAFIPRSDGKGFAEIPIVRAV